MYLKAAIRPAEPVVLATEAIAQVSDSLPNSQRVIEANPALPKTKLTPVECEA